MMVQREKKLPRFPFLHFFYGFANDRAGKIRREEIVRLMNLFFIEYTIYRLKRQDAEL